MNVSNTPGTLKRLTRTPWKFQRTFLTPLDRLESFASRILQTEPRVEKACITVSQPVFHPKHLAMLLAERSLAATYERDCSITADTSVEAQELLQAALGDWMDFWFVPTPKPFVIFADHDEFTTFFANTKSNLNRVVSALSRGGFKEVEGYERPG